MVRVIREESAKVVHHATARAGGRNTFGDDDRDWVEILTGTGPSVYQMAVLIAASRA